MLMIKTAGALYPILLRALLERFNFSTAVQLFSIVPAATSLLAFALAVPNPDHIFRKPKSWKRREVWVDMDAFRNPAFNWFTAGVCFMFFGFYAIFFNFEDVSSASYS
jgi:MCP family monocarboxylic acid transporter-like MFS transporter 10